MKDRMPELDGMRGVAIILVVLYHYFYRFQEYYPYDVIDFAVVANGALGVHLFFIISGFVIALTLLRCDSFSEFVFRRLGRLWPPLAVCSVITFVAMYAIDNSFTAARRVSLLGFLPTLTLTEPSLWRWLSPSVAYVDGVYWSLFVEVRFYVWVALTYFVFGRGRYLVAFLVGVASSWAAFAIAKVASSIGVAGLIGFVFVTVYTPLFVAGMLFHEIYDGRCRRWTVPAILVCALVAAFFQMSVVGAVIIASYFLLFFVFVFRRPWIRFLGERAIVWVGLTSYSTYLLHQNIGVALVTSLPRDWPQALLQAAALLTAGLIVAIASVIYFFVEKNSYRIFAALFGRFGVGRARVRASSSPSGGDSLRRGPP